MNLRYRHETGLAKLSLGEDEDYPGGWWIDWLSVPIFDRGKGYSRRVMDLVLADADRDGVVLTLAAHSCGDMDHADLISFYERLGFVATGQHHVAFKGPIMQRAPKP